MVLPLKAVRSSPFMVRWVLPIHGEVARSAGGAVVQEFTSPLAGEVGPKGRVGGCNCRCR